MFQIRSLPDAFRKRVLQTAHMAIDDMIIDFVLALEIYVNGGLAVVRCFGDIVHGSLADSFFGKKLFCCIQDVFFMELGEGFFFSSCHSGSSIQIKLIF